MKATYCLLEYVLMIVCDGNRSECARKLRFRRTDFNRTKQMLQSGSMSPRMLEAVIDLFCEMNLSLDTAFATCRHSEQEQTNRYDLQRHRELLRTLRMKFADKWVDAANKSRIYKSANELLVEMEKCLCNESCEALRDCESDCPCKRFAEFMDWLVSELERPQNEEM